VIDTDATVPKSGDAAPQPSPIEVSGMNICNTIFIPGGTSGIGLGWRGGSPRTETGS
jgi:hypothetical protein